MDEDYAARVARTLMMYEAHLVQLSISARSILSKTYDLTDPIVSEELRGEFNTRFNYSLFIKLTLEVAQLRCLEKLFLSNIALLTRVIQPLLQLLVYFPSYCHSVWGILLMMLNLGHQIIAFKISNRNEAPHIAYIRERLAVTMQNAEQDNTDLSTTTSTEIRKRIKHNKALIAIWTGAPYSTSLENLSSSLPLTSTAPYTSEDLITLAEITSYTLNKQDMQCFSDLDDLATLVFSSLTTMISDPEDGLSNALLLSQLFSRQYHAQDTENFLHTAQFLFIFVHGTFYSVPIQSVTRMRAYETFMDFLEQLFTICARSININEHPEIVYSVNKTIMDRSTHTLDEEYLLNGVTYEYKHNFLKDISMHSNDHKQIQNELLESAYVYSSLKNQSSLNYFGWKLADNMSAMLHSRGRGDESLTIAPLIKIAELSQYQIIMYATYNIMSILYLPVWGLLSKTVSRSIIASKKVANSLTNILITFLRYIYTPPSNSGDDSIVTAPLNHLLFNFASPMTKNAPNGFEPPHSQRFGQSSDGFIKCTFGSVIKDFMNDSIVAIRRHEQCFLTSGCTGAGSLTNEQRVTQPPLSKLYPTVKEQCEVNKYNVNNIIPVNAQYVLKRNPDTFWDFSSLHENNGTNMCNNDDDNNDTSFTYTDLPYARLVRAVNDIALTYTTALDNWLTSAGDNLNTQYFNVVYDDPSAFSRFLSILTRYLVMLMLLAAITHDYYRSMNAYVPIFNPLIFERLCKHFWSLIPEFRIIYKISNISSNSLNKLNDGCYKKMIEDGSFGDNDFNRFKASSTGLPMPFKTFKYLKIKGAKKTDRQYDVHLSEATLNLQTSPPTTMIPSHSKHQHYDPHSQPRQRIYETQSPQTHMYWVLSMFAPVFEVALENFGVLLAWMAVDISLHAQDYPTRLALLEKFNILSHVTTITHRFDYQRGKTWLPHQWSLGDGLSSNRHGRIKNAVYIAFNYAFAKPGHAVLRHNKGICFNGSMFLPRDVSIIGEHGVIHCDMQQSLFLGDQFIDTNPATHHSPVVLAFGSYNADGTHCDPSSAPQSVDTLFFPTQDPYLSNIQFYNHTTDEYLAELHQQMIYKLSSTQKLLSPLKLSQQVPSVFTTEPLQANKKSLILHANDPSARNNVKKQFILKETLADSLVRGLYIAVIFNTYFQQLITPPSPHVETVPKFSYHPMANLFAWMLTQFEPKLSDYLQLVVYTLRLPHQQANIVKHRNTKFTHTTTVARHSIGLLSSVAPVIDPDMLVYCSKGRLTPNHYDFYNETTPYYQKKKSSHEIIMKDAEDNSESDDNSKDNTTNTSIKPLNEEIRDTYRLLGDTYHTDARLYYGAKWLKTRTGPVFSALLNPQKPADNDNQCNVDIPAEFEKLYAEETSLTDVVSHDPNIIESTTSPDDKQHPPTLYSRSDITSAQTVLKPYHFINPTNVFNTCPKHDNFHKYYTKPTYDMSDDTFNPHGSNYTPGDDETLPDEETLAKYREKYSALRPAIQEVLGEYTHFSTHVIGSADNDLLSWNSLCASVNYLPYITQSFMLEPIAAIHGINVINSCENNSDSNEMKSILINLQQQILKPYLNHTSAASPFTADLSTELTLSIITKAMMSLSIMYDFIPTRLDEGWLRAAKLLDSGTSSSQQRHRNNERVQGDHQDSESDSEYDDYDHDDNDTQKTDSNNEMTIGLRRMLAKDYSPVYDSAKSLKISTKMTHEEHLCYMMDIVNSSVGVAMDHAAQALEIFLHNQQ